MSPDTKVPPDALALLREQVEKALTASGKSARRVSIDAVGHDGLIRDLRAGRSISYERAAELARSLDLELYFGPPRTAAAEPPALELAGEDFVAVRRVAAEAAAGPSRVNDAAAFDGALAFRRDWLRARGVDPGQALLVSVTGDSMAPTIAPGDLVLLDCARRDAPPPRRGRPPPVFVFDDADGMTRIKRLARIEARTLLALSDNAADHPPELLRGADVARIRIHGRVVWWGHTEDAEGPG